MPKPLGRRRRAASVTGAATCCCTAVLDSIGAHLPLPVAAELGHGRVAHVVADAVSRHHPTLVVLGRPDPGNTPDELASATALAILLVARTPCWRCRTACPPPPRRAACS